MTEKCGYEGGGCSGCYVTDYGLMCDGGEYNTEEYLQDGSDCILDAYPNCHVDIPSCIGDGICNGDNYMISEGCKYDGLDCQQCNVTDVSLVGDGICNDDVDGYNVKDCSWDGQDCNYALERHTAQSSALKQTLNDQQIIHGPRNSVDGNRHNGQLSITQNEYNPWWKMYQSGPYYTSCHDTRWTRVVSKLPGCRLPSRSAESRYPCFPCTFQWHHFPQGLV